MYVTTNGKLSAVLQCMQKLSSNIKITKTETFTDLNTGKSEGFQNI